MCGIAGLFYPATAKPIDPARLAAMTDALAHRGPDGNGYWTAPGVGFGHRRLSIIDLAGGAQPMALPGDEVVVSYNGEIYNFQEVSAELERKGARFTTHSDTEVLLHGWRAWGPDLLTRLNGMFAFALYDSADPQPVPGARPDGGEAALSGRTQRRRAGVRVGVEGTARASAGSA